MDRELSSRPNARLVTLGAGGAEAPLVLHIECDGMRRGDPLF